MTTHFKSTYSEHDAFYLCADLLRPMFGQWDAYDPVSHAILDFVEAQRELSDATAVSSDAANKQIKTAVQKCHAADETLMEALEDRYSWPDPDLGR